MIRAAGKTGCLKRHVLLDLTDRARQRIVDELAATAGPDVDHHGYAQILLPQQTGARIPGIVRRDETGRSGDRIPVGFCSPAHGPGGRSRLAAFVDSADITRITAPYELLTGNFTQRNSCMIALAICMKAAGELELEIGVWGSAALELYSGLPFTHDESDLDLLVAPAPRKVLAAFLKRINAVENRFGLRIDVEVDLDNGYGVHLQELLGNSHTLLGKSRRDVALLTRARVLAQLPVARTAGQSTDCREDANE